MAESLIASRIRLAELKQRVRVEQYPESFDE